MKKILSVCFIALTAIVSAKDGFRVVNSDANSVTLEYSFSGLNKQAVEIDHATYYKLWADNCVPVLTKGLPQVLRSSVSVALPLNADAKLEIMSSEFSEITNLSIAPSRGSLTRNINPESVPYVFGTAYSQNAFYPATPAEFTSTYNLRNQKAAALSIYPVQANPFTKIIKVYSKLVLKITYVNKTGAKVKLNVPQFTSNEEKQLFSDRFINFSHVTTSKVAYAPLNEYGSMLVICHPSFTSNIQPLVDWKNQKGIKTTLVSSAVTGTTGASIKSYIQTYYSANANLLYVLLVGDHEQINSFNNGTAGSETKWGDTYYGFLTGTDHYPEVMVGRFSGSTPAHINTMVNRTLEYEKTPLQGNWYSNGIGIGSNEGYGIGDDNEPDWLHMRNIGNKLLASGYTAYREFYDSTHGGSDAPGDPNATMVTNTVSAGASIFLYCGHGSQNTCVTSNFSTTDVNNATNYGKYPFSIQVACNNGTFIGGTCFSESFVRATGSGTLGPKGAIASAGSSILMAWAEPMQTEDEIGDILSGQYANNKKYTIGGLFYNGQMSMLDNYPTATGKEVMETWVMFGDPSCMFRSQNPAALTVSHNPCYNPAVSSFSFTSSFGPNAYACVSQNNQIVGTGAITSANTSIAFTQTYSASQPLVLTVTEYNKTPYTATLSACITTGILNNSASDNISIETVITNELAVNYTNLTGNMIVLVYDMSGKMVVSQAAQFNGNGSIQINALSLAPAVYLVSVNDSNGPVKTVKVIKQ